MNARNYVFLLAYSLVTVTTAGQAKEIYNHRWRYSFNVPVNWLPQTSSDSEKSQTFQSPDQRLQLKIRAWEHREVKSLHSMYLQHLQQLNGQGIVSRYQHLRYNVLLARINYYSPQMQKVEQTNRLQRFSIEPTTPIIQEQPTESKLESSLKQNIENKAEHSDYNTVAYTFYFYGTRYAYRVTSIRLRNSTPLEQDIQYSVLDSFGFEGHNPWNAGPISSYFIYQKQYQQNQNEWKQNKTKSSKQQPVSTTESHLWNLGAHRFRAVLPSGTEQTAEKILKREYQILHATEEKFYSYALERFYYMNFRQNYQSLLKFAAYLKHGYQQQKEPAYEALLYDLQSMYPQMEQEQPVKLDIVPPSRALASGTGNIATLALIHAIIQSQFQNNALILYSPEYSQLLVGVEPSDTANNAVIPFQEEPLIKNKGVIIEWYQSQYLIGELTAPIYIGWARKSLQNLEKWIPVTFPRYTAPGFFP